MTDKPNDWRERFNRDVPWHDGIKDNYVYVKDVEAFIQQVERDTMKWAADVLGKEAKDCCGCFDKADALALLEAASRTQDGVDK